MALKITEYVTRIQEGFLEGVCVIKLDGRITLGEASSAFRTCIQKRISEGMRFIVLDCAEISYVDSSGIGELASALTRIKARGGKLILLNSNPIKVYLQITQLTTIFEYASDLATAVSMCKGVPPVVSADQSSSPEPPEIKYEDKFSIAIEEDKGRKKKMVVSDNIADEPVRTEYRIREVPSQETAKALSPKWLLLVVLTALLAMAAIVWGLVWVAKTISSIPLITLIFGLAVILFILLSVLVLLLSGHFSEQTAAKLFGGVLGKIPGLGAWIPKTSKK